MERKSVNSLGMFDLGKGIFVLSMILGHASEYANQYWNAGLERSLLGIVGYYLFRLTSHAVIPMFFMICGYTYRKKPMKKAFQQQLRFIWLPYLLTALAVTAGAVAKKLVTHGVVLDGLKFQALPYLLGNCPPGTYFGIAMDSIGPLWFVVAFVFAGIFLNAVLQEKQTWVQLLLVGMLAAVGVTLREYTMPFCLLQASICTLYMYLGWLMKKGKFLTLELPGYLVALAVGFLCFASYFGEVEVSYNRWTNGFADVFAGVLGGGLLLLLLLKLNRFQGRISDSIRWLGRQAFNFCCIHTVFYVVIPWDKVAAHFGSANTLIAIVVYAVTGIGGCWAVEKVKQYKVK